MYFVCKELSTKRIILNVFHVILLYRGLSNWLYWVGRIYENENGTGEFEIIPNAWIESDNETWYPKSKNKMDELVKESLPPANKGYFKKCRIELFFGHGKCITFFV